MAHSKAHHAKMKKHMEHSEKHAEKARHHAEKAHDLAMKYKPTDGKKLDKPMKSRKAPSGKM